VRSSGRPTFAPVTLAHRLVPGIIPQLGPESIANLRKMAESYGSMQSAGGADDDDDDDDVPVRCTHTAAWLPTDTLTGPCGLVRCCRGASS
jgi:hypothetical protein